MAANYFPKWSNEEAQIERYLRLCMNVFKRKHVYLCIYL